jgi:hypothetical protein
MNPVPEVRHHLSTDLPLAEYERWLATRDDALIYAAPMFHRFLRAAVGGECHYLLALRHGRPCGVLPFFVRQAPGIGCLVNSLPWYGTHGACVGVDPADATSRPALLAAFAGLVRDLRPLSTTLVLTPDETAHVADYRAVFPCSATDSRIGQLTPLPPAGDDRALAATLLQKTRNLVNKSLRQGFREELADESEDAWRFLCEVHTENLLAIGGKPKPRAHFEALRKAIPPTHRRLSVAWLGDEPVAALLLLSFNRTVEYLTPVIRAEYRSRQPLSFLIWHGMSWAMARGFRWWNWGGTWHTQSSLLHFKAGWGAVARPYEYVIDATPDAIERFRADIGGVASAFPYFYVFPHGSLR